MHSRLLLLFVSIAFSFCSYTEKIRDGRSALERKQYHVAIPMLEKEFKKEKNNLEKGKIAFAMGEALQKSGNMTEAVNWYKIAADFQFGAEALRAYANGQKYKEQYADAIQAFKDLGVEIGSNYEVKKDIVSCQNAILWKQANNRSGYTVEKAAFNSIFDDYAPAIYTANQLVITSDRPNPHNAHKYKWTGRSFSDLFIIDADNNTVKNFGGYINTAENEGTVTFNADHSLMIFCRSVAEGKRDDAFVQLLFSKKEGALWGIPEIIGFCKDNVNYWHPVLSGDGKKLFFSSNDPDGIGGFDIYSSELNEKGEWDQPRILSKTINTPGDELFPTLQADTLYFSSNYMPGMGGFDIFKSYPIKSGWAIPQNMKSPINSGADDFSFLVDHAASLEKGELQKGYFTSNRKGGSGGDDIYRFIKRQVPSAIKDTLLAAKKGGEKQVEYQLWLDGYVLEKIYQNPDNPNSKVLGRKPVGSSTIVVKFGKEKKEIVCNEEGYFTFQLQENMDYQFLVRKSAYLVKSAELSTRNAIKDPANPVQRYELELELDRIFTNKEIILNNIYYDFDKSEIREDAKPTLNELAKLLQDNPNINIQLSSHTDCLGNEEYNADLSQRRAQSAVDYLISLGIQAGRLNAKGFGESQPAVNCSCNKCTEAENQANRRTTFTILE
ncbi:MAG: OmpA family protein [Saprospiraceae bacterium]